MTAGEIELLLKKGRLFEAYNLLETMLADDPKNIRLRQLSGLALARLGLLDRAKKVMEDLSAEDSDSETSGILGRIYKDFWKATREPEYLKLSIDTYMKAFLEKKDGYNGINAATLTFISGDTDAAKKIARTTISYVEQWPEGYWREATLGEAYLLTGDRERSRKHYEAANECGKMNTGDIYSTVEQLRLISSAAPDALQMIDLFDKPTIVIFAGHMIDAPGRAVPRFPESSSRGVKDGIADFLARINAKIGYTSLACGGDVLFAESALERGMELNVIFPFRIDDFLRTSVEFAGKEWAARFHSALDRAHSVKFTTEEGYHRDDFLFDLCARQVMGLGILRAKLFSAEPWLCTVWDGEQGSTGGTSDSVGWFPWPDRHFNIIPAVPRDVQQARKSPAAAPSFAGLPMPREMKYILFSDISGFSKLEEEKTPLFILQYFTAVSERLTGFSPKPRVLNTWGDAIFAVMDNPADLARYAFALRAAVVGTDWTGAGLPAMNLRIALHAGPVFITGDPLIGNTNAYGSHINRAARMEPVTAPGSVYASEQFAAALLLECGDAYRLDYAGMIELPKKFGKQEMYRVREGV